jgi:hypothetical protein
MPQPTKPALDVDLLERLVKKHFGPMYTAKLAWNVQRNRYCPSDAPARLAFPQKVFGVTVWWKAIGEFRDTFGFRLELWDLVFLKAAQALVAEYNAATDGSALELHPLPMHWPASPQLSPAPGGR